MANNNERRGNSRRYLVVLSSGEEMAAQAASLDEKLGLKAFGLREWTKLGVPASFTEGALLLESLGVAAVTQPRERLEEVFGPDRVISNLQFAAPPMRIGPVNTSPNCLADDSTDTWGRVAVRANATATTGRGGKVCVVDSGFARNHPDFRGRSFVPMPGNGHIPDYLGHGSHCTGVIWGGTPATGTPRYSVASRAQLYVANVFGVFPDTSAEEVFKAVEWAIQQDCDVVSLSLQRPVLAEDSPAVLADLQKLDVLARRALDNDTLLVASVGNASDRKANRIAPASYPAACPNVLAVGAVDRCSNIMNDCNDGANVFGPGELVLSANYTGGYWRRSGTSMAAAFVSGVAALHVEDGYRGRALMGVLRNPTGGPQVNRRNGTPPVPLVQAP